MLKINVPDTIYTDYERVWVPHPGPQTEVLTRNEFEVLYGGARGGGKTDAGIMWLTDHVDNPRYRCLIIRKNADDLSDWVDRAKYWYGPMGATFAYRPTEITWPSGAVFKTGHLKDADAYTKYQGHEYQRMLIEEATQIPDVIRYLQLIGSCRSTVEGIRPQVFLTANPGNIGHQWVKERFVDPSPPNTRFLDSNGRSRIYVPSNIDDNPTLKEKDPGYVQYLDSLKETNELLWKAWRYGDWSIFAGQVLRNFRVDRHVISKLPIALNQCRKIIGFDWGYNAFGAASFVAVPPKNQWGVKHYYNYREVYQREKTPEEWADYLNLISEEENIDYMVLPHDCYSEVQGRRSIESIFKERCPSLRFVRGNTLSKGARHQRLAILQTLLTESNDEPVSVRKPRIQFHDRCVETLRTLPLLVYDERDIEDIDTDGEDHLYDALTLALLTENQSGTGGAVVKPSTKKKAPTVWGANRQGDVLFPDILEDMKASLAKQKR